MVAFGPVRQTRKNIIFSLYNSVHAVAHICVEPLFTAAFRILEKIETLEVYI